jgi:hypothetical protein
VRTAWEKSGFRTRLNTVLDDMVKQGLLKRGKGGGMSFGSTGYWTSREEMFARTFERYVQRKLEQAGRKNTYLAGIESKAYKQGGLWPTDEEVDLMSPVFDKLFVVIKSHRLTNTGEPA